VDDARVDHVVVNPVAKVRSNEDDVVVFEILAGKLNNNVRLASRKPSFGETVHYDFCGSVWLCVVAGCR
jgi:hypothetical protein